ncbi:hypothetical protein LTR60_003957, partial [Cryomyces antarcticus]
IRRVLPGLRKGRLEISPLDAIPKTKRKQVVMVTGMGNTRSRTRASGLFRRSTSSGSCSSHTETTSGGWAFASRAAIRGTGIRNTRIWRTPTGSKTITTTTMTN